MAASCEHGTARIKVQVIATLLPLNISLHVDPFWSFIRFSESPTIRDVENKIVVCLNCMGKEYPAELVVHDSPITPAWTYLPPSSPVQSVHSGTHSHQVTLSKSNISDGSVSEQQLTIVLRPFSRRIGSWIHKPPKPVLMSYEISHYLPKSARLIFKTQLVFMHDCVLLSGSKSDILMDNDVVTVHAICYFCFVKDDGTSESQRCKQVRVAPEDEFESNGSLGDLDEDSLFCDTETQIRTNTEAKLPSEIRTKIDNLLKKLASLQHSNLNEKSATDCKKSKKRKAEEEDSRSELSNRVLAVSDRNDVEVEEKRKADERDIRSELSNRVLAVSDRNDVEVEEKRKADERDIRSELSNRVSGRTDAPSEDKKKVDHGDDDSLLSNSFIATVDRRSIESEKQQTKSVDHIWTQEQNSVNDETSADNLLSKSKKKKKKKHNKKMKYDVEVDSLMDTSVTQTTDVIKQTLQACFYVNDKHNDLVQVDSAANMAVPPAPSTARGRKRKPRNPSDYAVSSLLCVLRKQQTHEINRRGGKDKSQINSQKVEKQRNENTVSEKTDVSFHDASDQLNSSVVSPKRKRIRKRKQKNVNLDKHTSVENISKIIVRDYTLKLPEHQMPKNSRVTFECESDGDEDGTSAGQTVEEDMQSVSSANLDEHPPNENNVAESTIQLCSQPEEEHKSAHQRIARSDITKTSPLNVAGAPINPDEKFQSLLNQCGRTGRQFETINSANGHTVIRSSRKKHITHAGLSALAATVDLEEDVLTNVSIVLQNSSEAKTPTSNSCSLVQCFPTEVGDNMSNLSHLSNDKLNTRSLITSIQDLKPVQTLVEVTPLYMNYSSCTELCGLPKESDIIAYKILEMAEDYTPGLSNFKEAKVIQVDAQTGHLLLEPRGGKDNKKRLGRFEINFNDNKETGSTGDEELVATNLTDLVDARLVFRADGSQ